VSSTRHLIPNTRHLIPNTRHLTSVAGEGRQAATINGLGVFRPGSLAPVAEATGFEQQVVQERPVIGRRSLVTQTSILASLMKAGAELLHGLHDVAIALDPTAIARPG